MRSRPCNKRRAAFLQAAGVVLLGKDQEVVWIEEVTCFLNGSREIIYPFFFIDWQSGFPRLCKNIRGRKKRGYAVFFAHQLGGKPFSGPYPPDLYMDPMNDWLSDAMVTAKVPVVVSAPAVQTFV